MPALPLDLISDQFAYRPTRSTTAALVSLTHTVAEKLETCTYVRCLLIDYTKTCDMINYFILFRKIRSLTIYNHRRYKAGCSVSLQICHQVNSRSGFLLSAVLFRAPVQDPLVMLFTMEILNRYQSITAYLNMMMTLLYLSLKVVPCLQKKNFKMCNLTPTNFKLIYPKPKNLYLDVHLHVTLLYHSLYHLLSNSVTKLLGIYISVTVSAATHVEHMLSVANQRMYLLGQLKSQSRNALHIVFTAIVLSVVTCCHLSRDSCQMETKPVRQSLIWMAGGTAGGSVELSVIPLLALS